MRKTKKERTQITEPHSHGGDGILLLERLLSEESSPKGVKTFARAVLEPGASVGYHEHFGESEVYYILSGEGEYQDNSDQFPIRAGDVTVTYSGNGHGIRNTGTLPLEFIALIVADREGM